MPPNSLGRSARDVGTSPAECGESDWRSLIEAAKQGDDNALGEVCERLRDYLRLSAAGAMASELSGKLGASDLVQDTMLEACRDFGSFRGDSEEEFRAWIRRLLQRNLIDSARRYRHRQCRDTSKETSLEASSSSQQVVSSGPTASGLIQTQERDEELLRAVASLPDRSRRIVELRHRDGLSYSDISAEMGMSEVAARKLWSRTIESLAEQLASEDGHRRFKPR